MGRPTKKQKAIAVNLTICPQLRDESKAYAFENNESLSELVARLLVAEIGRPTKFSPRPQRDTPNDAELEQSIAEQVKLITPIVTRIRKANTKKK